MAFPAGMAIGLSFRVLRCGFVAGMAMVPIADLFNHKAAVVQLGGGYFVEDVCFESKESSEDQQSVDLDDPSDASSDDQHCHQDGSADSSGRAQVSEDESAASEASD